MNAPAPKNKDVAILEKLELPPESEWERLYWQACENPGLPFPLGYLLSGVSACKTRQDHAGFVKCLTWFFETSFRFVLALMLRPSILQTNIDDSLWSFMEEVFSLDDRKPSDARFSLGKWKAFYFDCLVKAAGNEEARKLLPDFLRSYSGSKDEFKNLKRIYDACVYFRNQMEHGFSDGNAPDFQKSEACLYERGLIRLLEDFEPLSGYSLLYLNSEEKNGGLHHIDGSGLPKPLPETRGPLRQKVHYSRGPSNAAPLEVFLGKWDQARFKIVEAWSMHPFLAVRPGQGNILRARLFKQYLPEPKPKVLFDLAAASGRDRDETAAAEKVEEDCSDKLVELVKWLAEIVRNRRSAQQKKQALENLDRSILKEESAERDALEALLEKKRLAEEKRVKTQKDRIPYPRDPLFKGRAEYMEKIAKCLSERKSLQIQSLVYGMGGVGKTALAVEICHEFVENKVFVDGVLWYRVKDEDILETANECARAMDWTREMAAEADPEKRVREFERRIRRLDLLVVLDNADFAMEVIRPLFELFRGLPLLITSRNELELPGALPVKLGGLPKDESVEFVKAILSSKTPDNPEAWRKFGEESQLEELCKTLGFHPLAMKLAGFYMLRNRLPVKTYLKKWETRRDKFDMLAAELPEKERRLRDVKACFALSFEKLSPEAARMLSRMSAWQGRDFSLEHFGSIYDRVLYPLPDGHDGAVTAAADIPGQAKGLTGGEDGRVILWDTADPETPLPLDAPLVPVALSRADIPEPVALRVFEIVLDKTLSLRAEKDAESELDVFLSDAPELARRTENAMEKLEAAHGKAPNPIRLRFHVLPPTPDAEVSDLAEKTYRLSRLKFARPEKMVRSEWKDLGWPYEIKKVDFFGPIHKLMYGFPGESPPPENSEKGKDNPFSFLDDEGFLLGSRAAPVELPEDFT